MALPEALSQLGSPRVGATHQVIRDAFPELGWRNPADHPKTSLSEEARINVLAVKTAASATEEARWTGTDTSWLDPVYERLLKDPSLPEEAFSPNTPNLSMTGADGDARTAERAAFLAASVALNRAQTSAGKLTTEAAQTARVAAQEGTAPLTEWYLTIDNSSEPVIPNGLVHQFEKNVYAAIPDRLGSPIVVYTRKALAKLRPSTIAIKYKKHKHQK